MISTIVKVGALASILTYGRKHPTMDLMRKYTSTKWTRKRLNNGFTLGLRTMNITFLCERLIVLEHVTEV